ncbi:MAG: magnesium/cobalt efflux protein [Rhodobacterales bacterium]|nr:MAG: magnesium/cobalt efflux protein [Rhodobacterales bacterium]
MGETDGSSGAARRAQQVSEEAGDPSSSPDKSQEKSGLFTRLIGALSPADAGEAGPKEAREVAPEAGLPQHGMLNLRRLSLEDVMIPKAEIVAVPLETTQADLVEVFRGSGLSRLPVFDGTLDNPVGFVHLKDFALSHGFNREGAPYALKSLLRPLLFAPPSMPIGVLLQKMQAERMHMALVIDEYGGVDGLVTLEDLVEQVIGEIEDEHDLEEGALFVCEKPGCYLAESRTPLEEFEAETGLSLRGFDEDDDEFGTLGGLVFMLAGHVPARGEVIRHPHGPEFEVVDADPRRIKRLRVRFAASGAAE